VIQLENITRVYGRGDASTRALDGVSLEFPTGAFVTVVGTSGSGKTTLLNIVGGLDTGYSGVATVDGRDLKTMDDKALSAFRNQTVGFVFQHFNLLEHLSARQNVALPTFFSPKVADDALAKADKMLDRVGLGDKLESLPGQLSGGQKQRVAIARALFYSPRLMLCDEPTGNLDTTTGAQIISLFERLNKDDGLTVLVVTHEEFLFNNATHSVRLEDGRPTDDEPEPEQAAPGAQA
jgi:putative ABC transport system ATP-binding protein